VQGKIIPADHGYLLYSAISKLISDNHETENLAICGISGIPDQKRNLHLDKTSKLRIRIEHENLPIFLKLAGKSLSIGDSKINLAIPNVSILKPRKDLYSRLVTIKGFTEAEPFIEAVKRQLINLEIHKEPILFKNQSTGKYIRKTSRIHGKEIVGYPVLLTNLDPDESIKIQINGIGGRRKMGCGNFVGIRV